MAKWEYRVAYVDFRGRVSIEGQEILMEKGERRSAFVRTVLDTMGNDGWELAGVHPLWPAETSYMVFKREAGTGNTDTAPVAKQEAPEASAEESDSDASDNGEPTRSISEDSTELI
ncbi:MAG: hypothetical protein ABIQ44_02040 [Chloroflexia bacterium]